MDGPTLRCLTLLVVASALAAQENPVKVREEKLTLPTYNEGSPDPDPPFAAFTGSAFPNYPYTIRTPINRVPHRTDWRVLILENEYLSCRILPDLGGHLHGCTDRITGREIFYANPVIRRTAENPRGAFVAMGIESSFPIAHSRVDSSPVDFAWSVRDGVGTVVLEDTDRTSGMEWRVEFVLRPHSAVLEQHVTLYNGSGVRRAYHWWVNAAVELDDPHLRFVYPVKWMLPHGDGSMTSWPVDGNGLDLSDAANHKTQFGYFAHGSREPWMAIYKPEFRSGVAHYADPDRVRGKKIWMWGTADTYVHSVLTDKFNSYVEMQAGEFETQPEFGFLNPEETRTLLHYWIPFHDLGGVSRVTPDAVLHLSRTGHAEVVELAVTHPVKDAKIRLSSGSATIAEMQINLDPAVKFTKTLDAPPGKMIVDVTDGTGRILMHHVEGEYDALPFDSTAPKPETGLPSDTSDSEAATLARGTYHEKLDQWPFAWRDYQAGLKQSPDSEKLRLAAGRAAFALNRYDDAIKLLADMSGAEASYYFGVALGSGAQRVEDAQAALARAAKDPQWTRASRLQSALLAARESGEPGVLEATRILQSLAAETGAEPRIGALEVALLRRTGKIEDAKKRLEFWLERDPANNMLRLERSLLGGEDDASWWRHLGAEPERVLNLAGQYRQLGACDDAVKLLDRRYSSVPGNEIEPGTVLPQENPLVVYYRGYCRLKLGQDPKPDFRMASALSTLYIFPHREIFFRIFRLALQENEADAAAHALLGDLSFDSLQFDEAISEWRKALALKRDLPSVHRNLGRALMEMRNDPAAATPVLFEGQRYDPNDRDIAEDLKRLDNAATARALPEDIAIRALVRSPADADAAAALFTPANFPTEQQSDAVRRAYIEVQLQRLLRHARSGKCSGELPALEALGEEDSNLPFTRRGFGAFMKTAHFQYYLGVIENACGAEKAAKKRWANVRKRGETIESVDYAYPYLAAKQLGDSDAAPRIDAAVVDLAQVTPDERPALLFSRGVLSIAAGSRQGEAMLRKSLESGDSFVQYMSLSELTQAAGK